MNSSYEHVVALTAEHVRAKLAGEPTGHDWFHTERVWRNAVRIGTEEGADLFVVQLAALLHDIANWKFSDDETAAAREAESWLRGIGVADATIAHVCDIIARLSFKGAGVEDAVTSLEGRVVQDADRLDALGAIGIARAFAYGGYKHRLIHDPRIPPQLHATFEEYKNSTGTTINHFYEKLLLLKDRMHTRTARRMAEERHRFMEEFLKQFHREWKGEV